MKIRWNTTHAEILRGIALKPVCFIVLCLTVAHILQAINQWIDSMDQLVTGKAKAAAKRRQKKSRLSPDEWDTLAKLCDVLKVCLANPYTLSRRRRSLDESALHCTENMGVMGLCLLRGRNAHHASACRMLSLLWRVCLFLVCDDVRDT
jgi:hypothetical protein